MPEMPREENALTHELTLKDYQPPLETVVMLEQRKNGSVVLHIKQRGTLTPEAPVALDLGKVLEEVKEKVDEIVVDQEELTLLGKGKFSGLWIDDFLDKKIQKITTNPQLKLVDEDQTWTNISVARKELLSHKVEVIIGGSIGQLNGKVFGLGIVEAFFPPPLLTTVVKLKQETDRNVLHIKQKGVLTPEAPVALDLSKVLGEVTGEVHEIVVDQELTLSGKGSFVGGRIDNVLKEGIRKITINSHPGRVGENQEWTSISVAKGDLLSGKEVAIGGSIDQHNGKVNGLRVDEVLITGKGTRPASPAVDPHKAGHFYRGPHKRKFR